MGKFHTTYFCTAHLSISTIFHSVICVHTWGVKAESKQTKTAYLNTIKNQLSLGNHLGWQKYLGVIFFNC